MIAPSSTILRLFGLAAFALVATLPARAGDKPAAAQAPPPARLPVFEEKLKDFSDADYRYAVERLFEAFEARTGRKLVPGPKKKVGLKIYTDSGPGLETPFGLTRAVIAALEKRGFATKNIFLVGLNPCACA